MNLLRKYPLAFFYILACLFGWIGYAFEGNGAENIPLGPIVAALIITALMGGAVLRKWAKDVRSVGAGWQWFGVAIIAPIILITLTTLINLLLGASVPTSQQLESTLGEIPILFVIMLIFVGFGEEAGWTAFATPRLLDRYSFLQVWGIMSILRIFWHLPLMLTGDLPLSLGIFGNAAFQFLMLWLYVRSGRRWFPIAVWHATLNAFGGPSIFRMFEDQDRVQMALIMTAVYVVTAGIVYLVDYASTDNLLKRRNNSLNQSNAA